MSTSPDAPPTSEGHGSASRAPNGSAASADAFGAPLPDIGIELREGYAAVGDQSLHYVEAGDGPLIVLLHGFPEFWFGWRLQIEPLVAAGYRVVAPDTRGYNLSSKPEGFEAYAVDLLPADIRALIEQRGAESALLVGLLRDSWIAGGRGPCQRLALLPTLPARREPALHVAGDATLHRGLVAARSSRRDDQLLPHLGQTVPEGSASKASPDLGADLIIWGERDSYLGPELAEPDRDDVPNLDRVERLPDAAHWVHHDDAERVNQLFIDFFAAARPTNRAKRRRRWGRRDGHKTTDCRFGQVGGPLRASTSPPQCGTGSPVSGPGCALGDRPLGMPRWRQVNPSNRSSRDRDHGADGAPA
jgi:pimeloyl-ACP methyl ester carboxylesterase